MKFGVRTIGTFSFSLKNVLPAGLKAAGSPFILAALGCYVISVVIWLMVLSSVEVSYAYPLPSIGYIVTAFCGYMFLGENMDASRWLGVIVICAGVFLITRSA